ncbi:carbohydrate-binding protein [Ammonifex thiophilus]|uniref:Carbohydrate-binding protein n=1 Tax=Ammonifex thiophilus TaxID=444093 RepID=A0A3D8P5T6_9THEO|nr:carbohydrate-binding protein [Ammonifex thiophilus]RDV83440.1 carbohydrate-binding protein [Ammonifex thiophilus]
MLLEENREVLHPADLPGGVVVDPTPITAGEEVTIFYNGILARSGASQIYLHLGFGPPDNWHRVQDLKMSRTSWGWVRTISIPFDEERLNFCFWDGAGNWDNNNGLNWSYIIHAGRLV